MTKDNFEYQKMKADYEDKQKYKRDHPAEYPWFVYFQYGWHNMTYMTDEEVKDAVKFYHLYGDENGYYRFGRQPIFISRRK